MRFSRQDCSQKKGKKLNQDNGQFLRNNVPWKQSNYSHQLSQRKTKQSFPELVKIEQQDEEKNKQPFNSFQGNISSKKIRKHSKGLDHKFDKDYRPGYERKKKNLLQRGPQDYFRNVVPNLTKQIFSYIQWKSKSNFLLQKIFKKYPHPDECSMNRYYIYVKKIQAKTNHYVSENSLQIFTSILEVSSDIYSLKEQEFYMKACRIMITYYFNKQFTIRTLTSKRMAQQSKILNIRARRYLQQKWLAIFRQI